MTVVYALVGYSKATERMVFREPVPAEAVPAAKKIAHLSTEDDTQAVSYTHLDVYKRQMGYRLPFMLFDLRLISPGPENALGSPEIPAHSADRWFE